MGKGQTEKSGVSVTGSMTPQPCGRTWLRGAGLMLVATVTLGACASTDTLALSEDPDYARGAGAGCATAREEDKSFSTKRFSDEDSFENSRAYRAGWRQGYLDCRSLTRDRNDGGRILGNEDRF